MDVLTLTIPMIQLALATLTLIGLGFDLGGAVLVLIPDSRRLQSLFGQRDGYRKIKHGKDSLRSDGILTEKREGFEIIADILKPQIDDINSVAEVKVLTADDIRDYRVILDTFPVYNEELQQMRSQEKEFIQKKNENTERPITDITKYRLLNTYAELEEKFSERRFIVLVGEWKELPDTIISIWSIPNAMATIDAYPREKLFFRGLLLIVIGFAFQIFSQFIRVLTQPEIVNFINRIWSGFPSL